ncbi:MAG: glycosyltransferase family 2 protein, partial [Planctomycetes bacterium]|nr:glycosyltransferase family 2 protein [Planctomycetota bacterium]
MTKDRRPLSHDARSVVALIATTRGRFDLLARRAIPSVLAQSRLPDRLLVVVDHTKQELDDPALKLLADTLQKQCGELEVTVLRNRRTPSRAAGAWNTAIDQMHRDARIVAQPEMWFVAILDDDDAWAPDHVALCLDEAVTRDRNMVVAGLVRHETPNDAGHPHAIPERLDAREQFIRGQHIQGSNLFVRLDLLLLVGGFDEHLPSCTDRDLCIRIAALDGLRFGRVARHTVHHFADPRHDRLSAPASQAKLDGLTRFWRKHADRFDAEARAAAAQRAKELFGWEPPVFAPATRAVPALALARNAFDIVAGFVTDARVPAHVDGLLTDLQQLRTSPGVASLRVVIVENGPLPSEGERSLRELVQTHRERGLAVELMTIERQRQDWEQGLLVDVPDPTRKRLPIAASRTVLNTYVARAAMERPRSVAWILDDDKRLSQWIDPGDGRVVERRSPDFAALCALRDAGWDVVIGPDTDAPPLPFAATLRVQLVDLAHTLAVFASLPWDSPF